MTSFRAALLAALCSIFLASCGDTFRPIAIPEPGTLPTPQVSKTAEVITDSGASTGVVTNYNLSGGTITGQGPLGQGPSAALLIGSRTYVANQTDNTLTVFSALSPQSPVPGTVTLRSGASPQALATTVVGSNLYVAYNALNAVGIVSTGSNTEVGVIFLTTGGFTGKGPSVMISDNAGTKLVVGNTLSNNLSIIDLVSNAVVATVNGCLQPSAMARTPDAPYVYVACQGSNNVLVVNTNTGFTDFDLPVGTAPNSLAFDAANKRLIVTNGGSGSVTFINENFSLPFAQIHSMTTVPIGAAPVQAASLPDGSRVYVATNGNNVVVIDSSTLTVKTSIAVPGPGQQISASSDSGRVAVTTTRPDPLDGTKTISELSVIDTATEAAAFTPPHVLAGLPRVLLVF